MSERSNMFHSSYSFALSCPVSTFPPFCELALDFQSSVALSYKISEGEGKRNSR